ncbi:MAG: YybH family protein [Gemmatimonadota bacterium]
MHRTALLVALLTGSLVAPGCGAETASEAADRSSDAVALATRLEGLNDALLARLGRGDAAGAAALYAPDALLLPPDGRVIEGRDAIRSFWAATVASTRILDAASNTTDVRRDGGLASVASRYTLVTSTDGGDEVESRGTTLLVWRRTGDGWRIHADMWTAEPTEP